MIGFRLRLSSHSYLDNYEKMNTDYSRYSYIYECLILDKINEISNGDTKQMLQYMR